ncbi:MAG: hypothetical protein ABIA77_02165, partial [Candidatus Omnitrophota bacterium]
SLITKPGDVLQESIRNRVYLEDVLNNLTGALVYLTGDVRKETAETITAFVKAGLIHKDQGFDIRRLLNNLIAGINDESADMRRRSAEAIKTLVMAGFVDDEDKKAIKEKLPLDLIISEVKHPMGDIRLRNARTLKHFVDAGLADREEIKRRLPARDLMPGFKKRKIFLMTPKYAEAIKLLVEEGLTDRDEMRRRIPVEDFISRLSTGSDAAGIIRIFLEAGLLEKERIKQRIEKRSWHDIIKNKKSPLDILIAGLGNVKSFNTAIKCRESLMELIEAGVIDGGMDGTKLKLIWDELVAGLRTDVNVSLTQSLSAQAIAVFVEKRLMQKGQGFGVQPALDRLVAGLSSENMLSQYTASAKAIRALAEAGFVTDKDKELIRKKLSGNIMVSSLRNVNDVWRLDNAETLSILVKAGIIDRKRIKEKIPATDIVNCLRLKGKGMDTRKMTAEVIKVLVKADLIDTGDLRGKLPVEDIISGLKGNTGYERAINAEVLKILVEAGIILKEDLKNEVFLNERLARVNDGHGARAIKNVIGIGLLLRDNDDVLKREDLERIFRTAYGRPIPAGFHYMYMKLLEHFLDDPASLTRVDRYLTDDMLALCRIDNRVFYDELFRMVKENRTPLEAKRHIEEIMQQQIIEKLKDSQEGADGSYGKILGERIAHILRIGGRIISTAAPIFKLWGIDFRDTGRSFSGIGDIVESCLQWLPGLEFRRPPVTPPGFRPGRISDIDRIGPGDLDRFLEGAEFYKILGRTLVFKTREGKYRALKFLKQSMTLKSSGRIEKREREDPGKLAYESEYFDYLNELKAKGADMQAQYPRALFVDGERVARVRSGDIPGHMADMLQGPIDNPAKTGTVDYIDTTDGNYTFMAYEADDPGYFTYLHEERDRDKAESCAQRNIHDLFVLAGYGLVHPDIIELFHNLMDEERDDNGRYIAMSDLVLGTVAGAGRLHAWEKAVAFPNMRVSGPADFAEMVHIEDLTGLGHRHSENLRNNLQRFPEAERKKFLLAHFMGNYLLAWALDEGKRLKQIGKLDWQDKDKIKASAETLKKTYSAAYIAFLRMPKNDMPDDKDIQDLIDWDMFARQMAFFMGGAYKDHVGTDIPEEIFGITGLRIVPGDGWGYIHREIIKDAVMKSVPGLKTAEVRRVIETYFNRPENRHRQIPEDVFVFKDEFTLLIKSEKDERLSMALIKLHADYSKGWRFDGINEDLGPVNGPNPLQELIKANYLYTMAMIGRYEVSPPVVAPGPPRDPEPKSIQPSAGVGGLPVRGKDREKDDKRLIAGSLEPQDRDGKKEIKA